MQQESAENWIDHIINKAYENYNGREIVIWGKYGVSESIKDGLKGKYGIGTAFFVDSDINKTDGRRVFSPEYLYGKSNKYYVIIPIAFYQSIKEKLTGGGYYPGLDYYYFCDCILRQEPEYYEDAHGNKIIGNYQGLKFVFSGFRSVIKIGENAQFHETVFYMHNNTRIEIGENVQFYETVFCIQNNSQMVIGDKTQFIGNQLNIFYFSEVVFGEESNLMHNEIVIDDSAKLYVKYKCNIIRLHLNTKKYAEIILEENVVVSSDNDRKTKWNIKEDAKFKVGKNGKFGGQAGECFVGRNALLKIGTEFSINGNYRIVVNQGTSILIGDDCMFSYDISMRSNDGHSIFDVVSRENVNSTHDINKSRGIVIGNHVWIGERVCILYNTRIGDSSIIGAMSLVKNKIPNNCIAAGIPTRVIKRNVAWSREYGANDITKCGQEYIHYTKE